MKQTPSRSQFLGSLGLAITIAFVPFVRADDPPSPISAADSAAMEAASRPRLARIFATVGARAVRKDEIGTADIELGLLLCESAVALMPDDVRAWRALLGVATLADPIDEHVVGLRRFAVEQIARLDPTDQVMVLRRLVNAIERQQTAEGRIAGYRTMLEPKHVATLGKPIAARLALDLALLLRRTGDQAGFEQWLAEAVALDPTFTNAVSMAAGYFRFSADDPAKEAELLVAAMIANPLDPLAVRGFATLLLDHGAYVGATRFLTLAARAIETDLPVITYDEVLGDLALAQLGSGDAKLASDTVRTRQHVLDEFVRNAAARFDPTMLGDTQRLLAQRYPLRPQLCAAGVVASYVLGDAEGLKSSREDLWRSLGGDVELQSKDVTTATTPEGKESAEQAKREAALQAAFAALWLGEDSVKAAEYLVQAERGTSLSDAAKARFNAWTKLRTNDFNGAVAAFEALADDSSIARLGKGLALQAAGRTRDAARELLAVARSAPGTLAGVSAKLELEAMLGSRIPGDEQAQRLEQVALSVPTSFDRLFAPNARVVRLRVRRGPEPQNVFEPIPVSLEITNESPIPLAIDSNGPIRELVAIQAVIAASGESTAIELPYMMVPIDRAFTIQPNSTLVVPIDLTYTEIGSGITDYSAQGCGIVLHTLVNWETTAVGLRAATFGDSSDSGLLRINGVSLTDEWIDRALVAGVSPKSGDDILNLVVLASAAADAERRSSGVSVERAAKLAQVWTVLAKVLPRLDPVTQAWLLVILPTSSQSLEPALVTVRSTDNALVRFAYLLRRTSVSTDPILDAAIRSDDAQIARYGRVMKEMMLHEEEVVRRDFNLGTSGARPRPSDPNAPNPPAGDPPTSPPDATPTVPTPQIPPPPPPKP